LSSDPEAVLSGAERRRLLAAQVAASRFFRAELLRATDSPAAEHLNDWGAGHLLSQESTWKVGYAPDSSTALVDSLRPQGYDFRTLLRAGLATESEDGQPRDQFRDRLMLVARDARLDPVGFVGISLGTPSELATSPRTMIHRPSHVLVGVAEQIDLLGHGATPVIVDDPVDAIAIEKVSRSTSDLWAGVPLCGGKLSTAQARFLNRYSAATSVVVATSHDQAWQRAVPGIIEDLSFYFTSVSVASLPAEHTPATLLLCENGPDRLRSALMNTAPLAVQRSDLSADTATVLRDRQGPQL
jgi:DNA primase